MKKLLMVFLFVLAVIAVTVVTLPRLTSKETCTYEEAIKFAKGKFVMVDGKKVHYIEKGSGRPIILIHGFLSQTEMWNKNIDTLASKFKVYALDLWGSGYSERLNVAEYSFDRYAQQIIGYGRPAY